MFSFSYSVSCNRYLFEQSLPLIKSLNIINALFYYRNEIGSCIEKAYEKLGLSEAARMLFFESVKPMKEYGVQVVTLLHSIQGLKIFPKVHWSRTREHQESTGSEHRNGGNNIC